MRGWSPQQFTDSFHSCSSATASPSDHQTSILPFLICSFFIISLWLVVPLAFYFQIEHSFILHNAEMLFSLSVFPLSLSPAISVQEGPIGEDAQPLKLWGVNGGSTCEETEAGDHSRTNCISQLGSERERERSCAPDSLLSLGRREKPCRDTEGSSLLPPVQ